jgi:cyclopropane fatty-acyl-phospholipid synthase-like methyltransferase
MVEKKTISEFYDEFTSYQISKKINIRHRNIFLLLRKFGLKKDSNILEIGCGIGTVTSLIAAYASNGKTVAVDISPKSIEIAKNVICRHLKNVEFVVSDLSDFKFEPFKFDFIVLPDVLEHIPYEQHSNLFKIFDACSHDDTTLFIHIPSPFYQRWTFKNKKQDLQIIDLDLDSDHIIKTAYENNFCLMEMRTYPLHIREGDYQYFIFKRPKKREFKNVAYHSYLERVIREIIFRIRTTIS